MGTANVVSNNFSGHGIVTMSATAISSAALLSIMCTVTCGSYSLAFMTMMFMSLYNSVLNFLLMCMAFTTECLMFAFMFSAFMTLSLSCVFAVNVMCMGTGAMTITIILTALALTIATMLSAPSAV